MVEWESTQSSGRKNMAGGADLNIEFAELGKFLGRLGFEERTRKRELEFLSMAFSCSQMFEGQRNESLETYSILNETVG
jgi:hypothetical protein